MNHRELNICFLGNPEVGKSCIINPQLNEYVPTIENRSKKPMQINNKFFDFNIFDTAGAKELNYLSKNSIKQCDLFVVVCSLTDDKSIDSIQYYIDLIQDCLNRKIDIPMIIVANKLDILGDVDNPIVKNQIKRINKKFNNTQCIISSSKNSDTISNILKSLMKQVDLIEKNRKQQLNYQSSPLRNIKILRKIKIF
ncbi:hypothetical protein RB653_004866 [Dictyostelium firmibasis]|uniref:Small GTPase n=1 Tax=Dictyostelium firmibasis TaxID=79012 RepID=A0AAN7UBB7_9MYCE